MPKVAWNNDPENRQPQEFRCTTVAGSSRVLSVTSVVGNEDLYIWDLPFGFIASTEAGHLHLDDHTKGIDFTFSGVEDSNHTHTASVSQDNRGSRKLTVTRWIDGNAVLMCPIGDNSFIVSEVPIDLQYMCLSGDGWSFGIDD